VARPAVASSDVAQGARAQAGAAGAAPGAAGPRQHRNRRDARAQAGAAGAAPEPALGASEARTSAARVGPAPWRLRTAANGITLTRIAATPLLVVVVLRATPSGWALGLWAALALSDAADGWLARRRGTSASGAFLDPLADKFLVLSALASMVAVGKFSWAPVALLAGREAAITAYRVAVARQGVSVPARNLAKAKTLVEFFTVGLVLLPVSWGAQLTVSHICLWAAVALAWTSGAQYLLDSRTAAREAAATA
jgi:CDP-diacylglycerol--glycerol-3-phosphate 3-phosphatidyltransferase